jgi:hypothetical protein
MSQKLLKEFIKEVILKEDEYPEDYSFKEGDQINPTILNDYFKFFHISEKNLGDVFTFTPRVPFSPFSADGYVIEDNFTNRISLAPSYENALIGEERPFIYAGDLKLISSDNIKTIDLKQNLDKCPSSPGNQYGYYFKMEPWKEFILNNMEDKDDPQIRGIEKAASPKELPEPYKDQFKGCVPDAGKTDEKWAVEPTKLHLVAMWKPGPSYKKSGFILTKLGADLLNKSSS